MGRWVGVVGGQMDGWTDRRMDRYPTGSALVIKPCYIREPEALNNRSELGSRS